MKTNHLLNKCLALRALLTPCPTALLVLAVGLLLAGCSGDAAKSDVPSDVAYYTCAMHPSVRSQDPHGKCPICHMDLIPVKKKEPAKAPADKSAQEQSSKNKDAMKGMPDMPGMPGMNGVKADEAEEKPTEFTVPAGRQQLIGVTYATVEKHPLQSTLRTVGTVAYDKQRHWDFVSRIEGYVQTLEVSAPGDVVEKGQPLVTIYSPEVLTTERELLSLLETRDEAKKSHAEAALSSAESLIESARRRLYLWNVTTNQIARLEESREATDTLTLHSPFKGVVQNLQVDQGRRVSPGDHLVDVADLSVIWVWAQFYQEDLPVLKKGLPVTVTVDARSEEKFNGKIALIDPFINDASRTVRVRIDIENPDFKLRPDMYVNVLLENNLGELLSVPASAVMPTGERNVVFVDKGEGRLEPRFIEVGGKYGDYYAVKGGLSEGERVVNSANFLIDAESKVQGALKSW